MRAFFAMSAYCQSDPRYPRFPSMSLVNTEIKPSPPPPSTGLSSSTSPTPTLKNKWSSCSSTRPTSPSSAPTELGDLADNFTGVPAPGGRSTWSPPGHPLHPQGVAPAPTPSARSVPDARRRLRGEITNNFEIVMAGAWPDGTFLIDPEGVIQFLGSPPRASAATPPSCPQVKAVQYVAAHPGEVCPARGGKRA